MGNSNSKNTACVVVFLVILVGLGLFCIFRKQQQRQQQQQQRSPMQEGPDPVMQGQPVLPIAPATVQDDNIEIIRQ